jgi:hypothetical protein
VTIDAVGDAIYDRALSSEAVRLYYLLADGKSLDEAAAIMGKSTRSLARYERQLRKAKYLSLHHVYEDGKGRRREYEFLKRADDRAQSLAS